MSKKKKHILVIGIVLILVLVVFLLVSQTFFQSENKSAETLFPGRGEMKQGKRLNGKGAVYNDDYIFFCGTDDVYYRVDISELESGKEQKLKANCREASCAHNSASCEAYVNWGEYFVFHGKLYKSYNVDILEGGTMEGAGHIIEVESGEEVFDNPVPADMPQEYAVDDSSMIYYVRVLNDDLVKVEGHRHAYLLDRDFHVKYCYYDVGKFPWGAVLGNDYYYVNDVYQMVRVNLNTLESETLDSLGKIFMGDSDGEQLYISNEFGELYKVWPGDMNVQKLADDAFMFSVQDKYIYTMGGNGGRNVIYDKDGNEIRDYTEYGDRAADCFFQIEDKVYEVVDGGIAYMDEDGKNYGELRR